MVLSTASLIAFVVIFFLLIIYGLYRIKIIEIPRSLLDLFGNPEIVETPHNYNEIDNKMFELFNNAAEEKQAVYYDISKEDLKKFLTDAPYIKEYLLTQQIYYRNESDGRRITYKHDIWVKNDKYRVDTYDSESVLIRKLICDGNVVAITDYTTYDEPVTKFFSVTDEFTFENQSGLPSIAEFLNEDLKIELVRDVRNNIYRVEYTYDDIPQQTEKLEISFDYGLILTAESKYDNVTVYNMNTTIRDSKVDDKIFEITLDK